LGKADENGPQIGKHPLVFCKDRYSIYLCDVDKVGVSVKAAVRPVHS